MSTPASASPRDRMIRVPRSLRSRLLGSTGIPFPLPFGVMFTLLVVNGLFEDTSGMSPEDRASGSDLVVIVAGLTILAVGGLVLGTVEWRRSVTLKDDGVEVHTGWRQRFVPWGDVEAIEFCQIRMGKGTTPAAELVQRDGSRVELRALAQTGRRVRQRQVDVLAEACARHDVDVRSDGSWWWRWIDLAGKPGGLRAAHGKPESGSRRVAVGDAEYRSRTGADPQPQAEDTAGGWSHGCSQRRQ